MAAALRPVALEGQNPQSLAAETKRSVKGAREAERELQRSAEMRRRIEVERRTDLEEPLDLQPPGWRNPFLAADGLPPPPRPPPCSCPPHQPRAFSFFGLAPATLASSASPATALSSSATLPLAPAALPCAAVTAAAV